MQHLVCRDIHMLWPAFAQKVKAGLRTYAEQVVNERGGYPVDIFETWRSMDRMAELYAQGRTSGSQIVTNSKPGYSWHFYGCAVDIVFKNPKTKQWTWDGPWDSLAPHLLAQGLEWLGSKKSGFIDRPHFQLTGGMKVGDAFKLQQQVGLMAVWMEIQKRLDEKKAKAYV